MGTKSTQRMSEREYGNGLKFVADVLSTGIERLSEYNFQPPVTTPVEAQPDEAPTEIKSVGRKKKKASPQTVKRTCGHSHKSVRMEHKPA